MHVCDRGGDDYEVFCHCVQQGCDWVIRASSLHRVIVTPGGRPQPLSQYLAELPVSGQYELSLRSRPGQAARTAKLEVRFGELWVPVPRQSTPYMKNCGIGAIKMCVIEICEVDPPEGVPPIRWVLYTSLPVETFSDAWQVIEYYEARWLVEEYHKALKTGCRVEDRGLRTASRLEAMVGLMSVVAIRLLQLKSAARSDPDRPAKRFVPPLWLEMLKAARPKLRRVHDMTIGGFYRELAKLGGFLGRKSDGDPGWITIWRGWEKLNTLVRGAELYERFKSRRQKCG